MYDIEDGELMWQKKDEITALVMFYIFYMKDGYSRSSQV